jgi:hypothetical protein
MAMSTNIERKTLTYWCQGDKRMVEENADGTFSIIEWHKLTADELRQVHAVLGEVLTDLAGKK